MLEVLTAPVPVSAPSAHSGSWCQRTRTQSGAVPDLARHGRRDVHDRRVHPVRRARRSHRGPLLDLVHRDPRDRLRDLHAHPALERVPTKEPLKTWEAPPRHAAGSWDRLRRRQSWGSRERRRSRRDGGRHRGSRGGSARCASGRRLVSTPACCKAVAAPTTSASECRLLLLYRVSGPKGRDAEPPVHRSPVSLPLAVAPLRRPCRYGRRPA